MIACSALLFPAGKVVYILVKQEFNKENKSIECQMVTEAVQECRQGRGMSRLGVGYLHEKLQIIRGCWQHSTTTVGHVRCPPGSWE